MPGGFERPLQQRVTGCPRVWGAQGYQLQEGLSLPWTRWASTAAPVAASASACWAPGTARQRGEDGHCSRWASSPSCPAWSLSSLLPATAHEGGRRRWAQAEDFAARTGPSCGQTIEPSWGGQRAAEEAGLIGTAARREGRGQGRQRRVSGGGRCSARRSRRPRRSPIGQVLQAASLDRDEPSPGTGLTHLFCRGS